MAGIYIHIPFCKQKCSYCDFCSFSNKSGYEEGYMACLYKEMELRKDELKDKVFDTVYFGGGTPSVIDPKYIYGAMKQVKTLFSLSKNPEITIEMNPGTVTEEKIALYKRAGINRFSVGLQTAIDSQLADLNRIHTARDFAHVATLLKGENFNADVMLGLKGQTMEDVKKTIDFAVLGGASHISMYALTVEDGTPIYTDYLNGELPDEDTVANWYEEGRAYLEKKGFRRYEISNFAKAGKESRHNQNYWARGEYVGFGLSASSFMCERRLTNTFDLDEYMKCILSGFLPVVDCEEVDEQTARFESIMLGLRTAKGLNLSAFEEKYGSFFDRYAAAYERTKDYMTREGNFLKIKDEYLYVQNSIVIEYMEEKKKGD